VDEAKFYEWLLLYHSLFTALAVTTAILTGGLGTATAASVGALFLFFLKAGAFVFGSGLAIVPFLYGGVVTQYHWLSERQFLDAVAVAMITPGPVVRKESAGQGICTRGYRRGCWRDRWGGIYSWPAFVS
jgi:chromate transport protein ChrA